MDKKIIHQKYLENLHEPRNDIFSNESIKLLNRKSNCLHPLEQLDILNRQVVGKINFPLIVVGGQAIAFWIWNYQNAFSENIFNNKKLFSYDIDYVAAKENLKVLSNIWNIELKMNDNGQPPSIAAMFAKDNQNKIKEYQGLKFYNEEIDMPNIIDFIFAPAGFSHSDIKQLPNKYFVPYFNNNLKSNIYILSPLGCIRSRLANIYQNIKRSTIFLEIERLHSLNVTFIAYQIKNINEGKIKLFYKSFSDYREEIMNSSVAKIDAKYNLNLIQPFEYFLNNTNMIEDRVKKEFIDGFLYYSHKNYLKLYNHKNEILKKQK